MLKILNSQSRTKEEFRPLDPAGKSVRMYTCGPTVYGSLHLGNARTFVCMDLARRYLEYSGYQVRYVTNFTDVDDKIIKRAIEENRSWRSVTAQYTDEYHRVMLALNILPADAYPRATDHIPEMIEIVRRLLDRQNAYVARDGDVYFDTASFERYGKLSGRKLEEEEAGITGRIAQKRLDAKKNPGDFVLWKLNKNDKEEFARAGEAVPRWPSPWGDGRPGWHLECSAMSGKYLGLPFDIHGGGQDLLFPHHEDEKAQTECAYHDLLGPNESVRYWVHSAFLNLKARPEDAQRSPDLVDASSGSVKMSKSLGNVWWVREMIWPQGPFDPMAVRMLFLGSHYRSPIVFEPALLDEAVAKLDRIYNALEAIERLLASGIAPAPDASAGDAARAAFREAMDDDFNSAGALSAIFNLVGEINQDLAQGAAAAARQAGRRETLIELLQVLGLRPARAASATAGGDSEPLVELLLQLRQACRAAKQYPLSDQVRDGLKKLGYEVEDLPGGKWVVKRV